MKSIKDQAGCVGTRCVAIAVLLASAVNTWSQGTFQNLDFESAVLIPVPGDSYGRVQFAPALSGWTGYLGTQPLTLAMHNSFFMSVGASVVIWGPDVPSANYLEGHYMAMLQAGPESFPSGPLVIAAIEQTGQIPGSTKSLQFLSTGSALFGQINVMLAGRALSLVPLASGPNSSTLYGADISAFAGTVSTLRFQVNSGNPLLDAIQFSSQSIPEPGIATLGALGAGLLGWRWRKRARVSV